MGYKNGQGLRFGMTYSIIKVKRFNENEVRGLERERDRGRGGEEDIPIVTSLASGLKETNIARPKVATFPPKIIWPKTRLHTSEPIGSRLGKRRTFEVIPLNLTRYRCTQRNSL